MDRRSFLKSTAATLGASVLGGRPAASAAEPASRRAGGSETCIRRALSYSMFPESMPPDDRFKLAGELGFAGIEITTLEDDAELALIRTAAERTGVRVHSVMHAANWDHPLTSPDAQIARRGLEILRRSIRQAHALGADAVLLVPAVVTPEVRYQEAWTRSQQVVREVLPLAAELKVTLAVENVGNRFLLSPLEFVRYIDAFESPYVRAYLDIGNCLPLWAYPQDWIRTLGKRICRLHVKDYDLKTKRWAPVGEGDVDWPAVCAALREIGYCGFATAELKGGDAAYLRDVAERMDRVFSTLAA